MKTPPWMLITVKALSNLIYIVVAVEELDVQTGYFFGVSFSVVVVVGAGGR